MRFLGKVWRFTHTHRIITPCRSSTYSSVGYHSTGVHPVRATDLTSKSLVYMGDNIVNFYAGQPPLNRLSFHRNSAEKLNDHLHAENARFILFKDFKPLVHAGEPGKTLFLSREQVKSHLGGDFTGPSPEDIGNKDRARIHESARLPNTVPALVFLGIDDRPSASPDSVPATQDPTAPKGVPYFALEVKTDNDWLPEGGEWGDARASASAMDGWEAGIFAAGRAMVDWNARNKFCPACGSPTYSLWGGWKRSCTTAISPIPGKEPCFSLKGLHNFAYPRTDPVIIMGILNEAGDAMLLGRQKSWPKGMYSCLAGFIEPGESFEESVRREVLEEAGIQVGPVRYSSSQPWPYPANLMVGCYGRALDGQDIRLDLDNELEDCQWFPRSQISALLSTSTGTHFTRADQNQLDRATSDKETEAALAPSEKTPEELERLVAQGKNQLVITRVPPGTAIAGKLIRIWAEGGLEVVSKL
ncbi:NUDIX hydrolase domain-like protein [Naematelia encephala]|uniref:NAD(+) diphosphatase n=1 Tax=Naematelia encephala TaxID=71784 RepID=A0A1Y2BLR2_9TREE|nr:NUDIX hydrolase domain-like protein [Naematelia encephala]